MNIDCVKLLKQSEIQSNCYCSYPVNNFYLNKNLRGLSIKKNIFFMLKTIIKVKMVQSLQTKQGLKN